MQRVGVLGASFNPPTLGHLNVIQQVSVHFDEILLVPSLAHAFQKKLAPIEHRLAMMEILMEDWYQQSGKRNLKIENIEEKLLQKSQQPSIYTYDVLTELEKEYQNISFILGPDNHKPEVWQKFYRYQDIEKKWPLFLVKEEVPIHSTKVREIVAEFKNTSTILKQQLQQYVSPKIAEYIIQHNLYTV